MQKINIKNPDEKINYPEDCERIKKVLSERGYWATLFECQVLWSMYSQSMAAGWLILPEKDEDVFNCVQYYFNEK